MVSEVAGNLRLIFEHQPLELADVVERSPIRQAALRFNAERVMKIEGPAVLAQAGLGNFVLRIPAVAIAPSAHNIKILQSESLRIDLVVTHGAAHISAMFFELLT